MEIVRENYLSLLEAGKDKDDVIKVITGMRRAGKSTLLKQYAERLRNNGVPDDRIFIINFEDIENQHITDKDKLNEWIMDNLPDGGRYYVFLDEIQNVKDWELSVSGLQNRPGCDLYITGSNSRMLSSELATHISGRYIEVKILPFSFREYLQMYPSDDVQKRFSDYLRFGGLPVVDPDADIGFTEGLLEGIFNTVMIKDILSRVKTDDVSKVTAIAKYLYSNIGNITNIDNIAKATGINNVTVSRYINEMCKAFLFYYAERYDIVGKKILKSKGKYYTSDTGMRNALMNEYTNRDISRPLENVIYLELIRRGYRVNVGSYKNLEVDFTATGPKGTEYFQICQTLISEETYDREIRPFREIRDNYPKTILTLDRIGLGSDNGVRTVNVIDWLLEE